MTVSRAQFVALLLISEAVTAALIIAGKAPWEMFPGVLACFGLWASPPPDWKGAQRLAVSTEAEDVPPTVKEGKKP